MTGTPRSHEALARLDARRVEIERQIIADLEAKFFATGEAEPTLVIAHLGHIMCESDHSTTGSPFTFSWFGIG